MQPLDATTIAAYQFIAEYREQHGFAPTVREVAAACFLTAPAILPHLDKLEQIGCISREAGAARTLQVIKPLPETMSMTQAVYAFIVACLKKEVCPTQTEIAGALYISTQAVRGHLKQLEADGLIERRRHAPRSIVLTKPDE